MQKRSTLEERLLKAAILALPLRVLSFIQLGYGFFQPATLLMIVATSIHAARKIVNPSMVNFRSHQTFGTRLATLSIPFFFVIAIASTVVGLLLGTGDNYLKATGILISLIIFFSTYYTVSNLNKKPGFAIDCFKSYVWVATFLCTATILEAIVDVATGRNWIQLFLGEILRSLPYPHTEYSYWMQYQLGGRYKGLMTEPRDLGTFTLPALGAVVASLAITGRKLYSTSLLRLMILVIGNLLTKSATTYLFILGIFAFFLPLLINNIIFAGRIGGLSSYKLEPRRILQFVLIFGILVFIVASFYSSLPIDIRERVEAIAAIIVYPNGAKDLISGLNLSVTIYFLAVSATVYSLQQNWLLGVGLGAHSVSHDAVTTDVIFRLVDLNRSDAYSMGLRLLSEVGILGAVAFIAIFWLRIAQFKQHFSRMRKRLCVDEDASERLLELYQVGQKFFVIHTAVTVELAFILLNEPTYFNPLPPLLLGFCWKLSYIENSLPLSKDTF
ncbi:MAG: hypothetical protein KME03_06580 [Aphanocapsa lilacina HA4352-LM1]|jgi:hypothetical protein|nr:hypothetical protein [Aphanocapsa lilacina HA4352-LM1]